MHERINEMAERAGLDPQKVHALAVALATPSDAVTMHTEDWNSIQRARYGANFPKPSGTKERRKTERQNKKAGRNQRKHR